MKTISITRAIKINQQSDDITVGYFAVIDGNSLLAVRPTVEEAHAVAGEIEDEHDRETDVYLVIADE
jgi:hypothetical protein